MSELRPAVPARHEWQPIEWQADARCNGTPLDAAEPADQGTAGGAVNDKHGTTTGYRYGCREACCREAKIAYQRAYRRRRREGAEPYPNRKVHIDDVEWLANNGEHTDSIAARLGVKRGSLYVALHRRGRVDLVERLRQMVTP